MDFSPTSFLNLRETEHSALFDGVERIWEVLPLIADFVKEKISALPLASRIQGSVHPSARLGELVYIGDGAVIEANAVITGPAWIGAATTVRSGAYLRENLLIGNHCVLGNSCEFKNSLLLNRCEVPHFNYVGDSILGFRAHLGAGVICSNVRLDRAPVKLRLPDGSLHGTGLRKFGAIIGDHTEIGCNSVLSPGSILGRNSLIYPLTSWSGILGERQIARHRAQIEVIARRSGDR